jgi:hypothetical protein
MQPSMVSIVPHLATKLAGPAVADQRFACRVLDRQRAILHARHFACAGRRGMAGVVPATAADRTPALASCT